MRGRDFQKMYQGSLVGAGPAVFALWGYAMANARSGVVRLNPKFLVGVMGGTEEEFAAAIEFLCEPDPHNDNQTEQGRRLEREGQFQYRVMWRETDPEREERKWARRQAKRMAGKERV